GPSEPGRSCRLLFRASLPPTTPSESRSCSPGTRRSAVWKPARRMESCPTCYTRPFRMLLELRGIQKRFGGVQALSDGNLSVAAGEAHLLLGENGAGKSTLMKILAGMYTPDAGQMLWNGREAHFNSPAEASRVGIAMVHQESLLAPHLSVAENIFLG